MPIESQKNQRMLELFLIVIALSLTMLLYEMAGYKLIVLNLFYLPVVLAGFFLGRYRGGLLALLCVIAASVVTALDMRGFASMNAPLVVGLAVILWGAVLGLTALLVGTLSDERNTKIVELHEAYVGVVEVLSRYLQSANPLLEARSSRVARLAQDAAARLRLPPKQIDDIRVAALLYDLESVEVTSRVIRKAMGNLETGEAASHTFRGADLVQSLGGVLTGAMPLLANQSDTPEEDPLADEVPGGGPTQLGVHIIRAARALVRLQDDHWSGPDASLEEALARLRDDPHEEFDPTVLDALEMVAQRATPREAAPA